MNALVKTEITAVAAMSESELLDVLENSLYPGADRNSIRMVLGYCKASGLDPMRKPVHIVPIWDGKAKRMRDVIMPGVGLYRTDAARTGEYAGITEAEFGPDTTDKLDGTSITFPLWARVSVSRRMPSGEIVQFTAREFWRENYAVKGGQEKSIAPNAMWSKRPYGQLAKCAEAQALRKAFPEVGSQPTADEMEGKATEEYQGTTIDAGTGEVIGKKPDAQPAALPPCTEEQFQKNLPAWLAAVASKKATADQIILKASTKYTLTEEQKAAISKPKPVFTFAQVADQITAAVKAKSIDKLQEAGTLIGEVADPKHREELAAMYCSGEAELTK